jgi:hypothetical protein
MIRPLTIATCLLACGSGLYLYQSKHEVQLLDRTIERTVHDTNALREQSRLLAAEWTMLNDPERLRQFSDTYLSLRTITPSQFTSLADLDSRLPAPLPEAPAHGMDEQELVPVADTAPPVVPEPILADDPVPAAAVHEDLPVPPIPRVPAVASAGRPADLKAPDRLPVSHPMVADSQARSVAVADARPAEQRLAEQRLAEQRLAEPRPSEPRAASRSADTHTEVRTQAAPPPRPIILAAPRPLPVNPPVSPTPAPVPSHPSMVATRAPYTGSLLGMAHGSIPPAPRPTPVNATYNSN